MIHSRARQNQEPTIEAGIDLTKSSKSGLGLAAVRAPVGSAATTEVAEVRLAKQM